MKERERPLAAGRSFALDASPPAQVELWVAGTSRGTWNVPEYLKESDVSTSLTCDIGDFYMSISLFFFFPYAEKEAAVDQSAFQQLLSSCLCESAHVSGTATKADPFLFIQAVNMLCMHNARLA